MQSNASYADWFRGRPKRIEILLDAPQLTYFNATVLADYGCETPRINYDLHNGELQLLLTKFLRNQSFFM